MFSCIFFGPPCCGKGTQSSLLAKKYDLFCVPVGDLLRKYSRQKVHIEDKINKGNYVDDADVKECIQNNIPSSVSFLCFDGFPRSLSQALILESILNKDSNLSFFFDIEVSRGVLEDRMHNRFIVENRSDDNHSSFSRRMSLYEESAGDLRSFYADIVCCINGNLSIDCVFKEICCCVEKVF